MLRATSMTHLIKFRLPFSLLSYFSTSSPTPTPPPSKLYSRRNVDFLLKKVPSLVTIPDSIDNSTISQLLSSAESFVNEHHSQEKHLDVEVPVYNSVTKSVVMSPRVKPILDAYREAGFLSMGEGGLDLPYVIQCAIGSITGSGFTSGVLGHFVLTQCAANLLLKHGSKELIRKFHAPLVEGVYTGTMALSETQAGSSLQAITTKARLSEGIGAGVYKLTGGKMWTSGADHDGLSDNIIHMLLAKVEGSDKISLFLVPKFLEDGSRNDYEIGGVNHKMGSRGLSNCYWNLEGATGYLVGEVDKGLNCMIFMMNEMRIHVGLGASICGVRGFQESLAYACERKQGKAGEIINYPDVKRQLLAQKVYSEGALGLVFWGAALNDSEDKDDLELLDLLTPVIKAWPSEWTLEANKWAIQVLGGYGYTSDFPLEQVYRDNRLNMIHEGANGIHALTLLGRNVMQNNGNSMKILLTRMSKAAAECNDVEIQGAMLQAVGILKDVTTAIGAKIVGGEVDVGMANAHEYLNMFGHTVIAYVWLEQMKAAEKMLGEGGELSEDERNFYLGKVVAGEFFFKHELVKIRGQAKLLLSFDTGVLKMENSFF